MQVLSIVAKARGELVQQSLQEGSINCNWSWSIKFGTKSLIMENSYQVSKFDEHLKGIHALY